MTVNLLLYLQAIFTVPLRVLLGLTRRSSQRQVAGENKNLAVRLTKRHGQSDLQNLIQEYAIPHLGVWSESVRE